MSRVLLAIDDPEFAVEAVSALEAVAHSVEHVFDLTEGFLRAQIVLPDAFVVDLSARGLDHAMLRRWAEEDRVPLVITSSSPTAERLARRLGASFFLREGRSRRGESPLLFGGARPQPANEVTLRPPPSWRTVFVDVVDTAIANGRARRAARVGAAGAPLSPTSRSSTRSGTREAAPAVLIVASGPNARAVAAAFLQLQLGTKCVVAESAAAASELVSKRILAVLLDCDLLSDAPGAELLRALNVTSTPIVPIDLPADDDAEGVVRAAWEALPALRSCLKRKRPTRAVEGG